MTSSKDQDKDVEELITAIGKKLVGNREILKKSLNFGRLTWRRDRKNRVIEIDLEPKL